ncbi:MAG: SRPBCC family protein [Polyangiaceae bacterium]|jgi:ribosome-associated toxin RatA of RatAB toxin-antitoxin module
MSDQASSAPKHEGPVVRVTTGRDGRPVRASARGRIERPVARVWSTIYDVERFARYLPMVNHARRRGDSVAFDLKFRVGFFSAGFEFTTHVTYEEEKWLSLAWTAGEPRDIKLRFALTPVPEEAQSACMVETEAEFDVQSLGWLVKYFLKHHPEIQHGIFPGITLVLLDSIRRATSE